MKRKRKTSTGPATRSDRNRINNSLSLLTLLCATGNTAAQEVKPEAGNPDVEGTLPVQVVEATKPAPRPQPVVRRVPTPAPKPEPAPLIISDTLPKPVALAASKYTQPLLDVPQSIQVLPQELLREQGATTLRDALRNVSGISLQAGEGGVPSGDNLSIRGFSARTDFFVDGIRDFGSYTRDPFNLEQVEVAKGPASANSGRGSTGGSINLVGKKAQFNDFTRVETSVGSNDLFRGTIDINRKIEGIEGSALRLNLLGHDSKFPGRNLAANQRLGIAASLGFGLEEGSSTRFFLDAFHMQEDNQPDNGIPWVPTAHNVLKQYRDQAPPVSFDNYYGSATRDFEETETSMLTARFEHDFSDSLTFRNQSRMGKTDRLSITTSPRFVSNNSTDIVRTDWKDRDETNTMFVNQSDFLFNFDAFSLHHDALFGFEVAKETNERRRFTPNDTGAAFNTNLYNPNPYDPLRSGYFSTGDLTTADALSTAVYLFDTIEVMKWLDLTGGMRFDRFELDQVDRIGKVTTRLNRVDEMASGRAAIVIKPAENGSVYFGYSTSFNPSIEGLTLTPNLATLDPETNETMEVGTKWSILDDKLILSGALFETNKTNARVDDPAIPGTLFVLEGDQRVQGLEASLAGKVTEWLEVYASYTHLDSEVLRSLNPAELGKELSNTPQNSFSLWTQADLPGGFFAGGGPVFVDSRFNSNANTREAPSYCTWDALVGYEVNDKLTLRVNIRNLTDKEYIDRVGGGHFIPGEGRSVMFTASVEF